MKLKTLALCFGLLSSPSLADDLSVKLVTKARGDLAEEWAANNYLSNEIVLKIKKFNGHPRVAPFRVDFEKNLKSMIYDDRVFNSVVYLSYQKRFNEVGKLLDMYYFDKMLALREMSESPHLDARKVKIGGVSLNPAIEAKKILNSIDSLAQQTQFSAVSPGAGMYVLTQRISSCISSISAANQSAAISSSIAQCIRSHTPKLRDYFRYSAPSLSFSDLNIRTLDSQSSGGTISRTGYSKNNKVTILNYNPTAQNSRIEKIYSASFEKVLAPVLAKYKNKSNRQMINEMRTVIRNADSQGKNPLHEVFMASDEAIYSDAQGTVTKRDMLTGAKHPQLQYYGATNQHPHQVFPNILDIIRGANSTLFINMFFFGGTTSASILEEVLAQIKKKPNLKVVLLHDELNGMYLEWEIKTVFNFARAYMAEHPNRLIAIPANVYEKKIPGVPTPVKKLMNNAAFREMGISSRLESLQGVSDHSKVVVADGDILSQPSRAFVGSKNWADTSGALSNDESVLIAGPHAHLVLDGYYYDFFHGVRRDWEQQDMASLWSEVFQKGWAQSAECKTAETSLQAKVEAIVCPFDILGRQKLKLRSVADVDRLLAAGSYPKVAVKTAGTAILRTGEHTWDGSTRSALNQDLELIYRARKQITISEQFVAQPQVVAALIEAKKRGVDVAIVMEGFTKSDPPGFPNILYLDDMQKAGIKIRFKRHAPSSWFPGEFHGKTLSIDGFNASGQSVSGGLPTALIIGSANKDFMTLTGAFRELQVEIVDVEASRQHDKNFWFYYNSDSETYPASLDAFKASQAGRMVQQSGSSAEEFMKYTRWFISSLYMFRSVQ